jgi:hypothetical protein
MKHGEIVLELTLKDEPSRLFRLWRSTISCATPVSASVAILKRGRSRWDWSPDFYFSPITPTERKLADVSLAQNLERLRADEIANTSQLHDLLWNWLSFKRENPVLHAEMPMARVSVILKGSADAVVEVLEGAYDLSSLYTSRFHLGFRCGQPNLIQTRIPFGIERLNDIPSCLAEMETCKNVLGQNQLSDFKLLLTRISRVYAKRAEDRRRKLRALAFEAIRDEANGWLQVGRRGDDAPIRTVEDNFAYECNTFWLKQKLKAREKQKRQYVWRASASG